MTLVDTSVWIEVFRRRQPLDLEELVDLEEVTTFLPIVQEVLQGFREEGPYRTALEAMFALPLVESPLSAALYVDAVGLYRAARRAGLTIRSSTDCLIAAAAIRHDLEILHADRDFTQLATISALRQRRV